MVGLQADNQGAVAIGLKLGPVHGYDNLGAFGHHIGSPVIEQAPDIELDVGQQAVDLLDRVLAFKTTGQREAIANGMISEPDSITPWVSWASDNTRLACMSCQKMSSMWLIMMS